jgi:serine/threonine protein kinase
MAENGDTLRSSPLELGRGEPSPPPERIGPYRILERIGEGGFGEIYAARQTEPVKRRVALKILKAGMDTKAVLARFEAERQALALMDHPNIAKVLDAGETHQGRPYFVMDLVKGVPITEYCEKHALSIRERLELFVPVCQAVQHAHQKGIIHRDLKPSNVLVTVGDGSPPHPKVIDFGIAKATTATLTERTIYTQQGQLMGTPAYMSPEQAEMGALDVDTRTDIYSLGVVLYELLCGSLPFDPATLAEKGYAEMQRILREEEPPRPSTKASLIATADTRTPRADPRALVRRLRGELDWIVLKAMDKDRTRRYETANGLAMDIRRYLKNEPVVAGPPSTVYRVRKFVRRHKLGIGVLAAVLITVTWALIESNMQRSRVQAARDEAEAVTDFLAEMLASVSPDERGRDVSVKEVLDEASKTIGARFEDRPLIRARLWHTIGATYLELGEYESAAPLLEQALEVRRARLRPRHPQVLGTMASLGELYRAEGRYEDAEKMLSAAVSASGGILGDGTADAMVMMNSLSALYFGQGKLDSAEVMSARVLELGRRELGEEHREVRKAMNNLASMYAGQGRFEEAKSMFQRALDVDRRTLGLEHPDALHRMNNLAFVHKQLGELDAAESLYVQVVESRKRVLGETHPHVLTSMNNLAALRIGEGRFAEAEPLIEEVVRVTRETLPHDKGRLGNALAWHGECLRGLGMLARAETALLEGLPLLEGAYGETNSRTLRGVGFLARVYEDRGDSNRAALWRGKLASSGASP